MPHWRPSNCLLMRFLSFGRVRILLRVVYVALFLLMRFVCFVLFLRFQQVGIADGMSSDDAMNVDVVSADAETSAQNDNAMTTASALERVAQDDNASTGFSAYFSPLACFPLLRMRSYLDGLGECSSGVDDDTSSISSSPRNTTIDLRDLKTAHAKSLLTDPSRPICQYEVPGGGECRDSECESIHLSRLPTAEPSDEETAHYLYARFAVPARSGAGVKEIKDALVNIRARSPSKAFDNRVAEAVSALGLR
ncbi:hypothetical protein C8Q72DRAFT_846089 [Fomitopsis betulina]|nr:hypothetical protein C8Q72DRAFT_846089 [Fomitopsis betulina]